MTLGQGLFEYPPWHNGVLDYFVLLRFVRFSFNIKQISKNGSFETVGGGLSGFEIAVGHHPRFQSFNF